MPFGDFIIKSKSDLIDAINEFGFLPFFENSIDGWYSIRRRELVCVTLRL